MKYLASYLLPLLLVGCASNNERTPTDESSLPLLGISLNDHYIAELSLEGNRYVGVWDDRKCTTMQCRVAFADLIRPHRSHIRKGSAELVSLEDDRLNCEWVSHHKALKGTCQSSDGRKFNLKEY